MNTQPNSYDEDDEARAEAFNKRLEMIGWGLFLIMIGGLGLVPDQYVPEGLWLIGTGFIMLGINAARYFYHLPLSWFTIILGLLALASGTSDMLGIDLPVFPILLILIGAHILLKSRFERQPTELR